MDIDINRYKYFLFKPTEEIFEVEKNGIFENDFLFYELLSRIQLSVIKNNNYRDDFIDVKHISEEKYSFSFFHIFPKIFHSTKYDKSIIKSSFRMGTSIDIDFGKKTEDYDYKAISRNIIYTIEDIGDMRLLNKMLDDFLEIKYDDTIKNSVLVYSLEHSGIDKYDSLREISSNINRFYKFLEGKIKDKDYEEIIIDMLIKVNAFYFEFIVLLYKYLGIDFYLSTKNYLTELFLYSSKTKDPDSLYDNLYSEDLFKINDPSKLFNLEDDYIEELKSEKEIRNHIIKDTFN